MKTLNTDIGSVRNVHGYMFGSGSIDELSKVLAKRGGDVKEKAIYLVDEYFRNYPECLGNILAESKGRVIYVSTDDEPTTDYIDCLNQEISYKFNKDVSAVIGIGGGSTLDTAKAISNLLTNGGQSKDYQGWDLVRVPGVYKIGVPTISGTGAEATRTCVMTNKKSGLKLGMNSEYTVFDYLILDPSLSATVPRTQYFFSGMDAWIHSIEAQAGRYRNPVGDAFSSQAIHLCQEVFTSDEMLSDLNRGKLMVASYLGGCAIATTYVGVVHPFSAGLSVVLGLHHCIANCITMMAMESFYPQEYSEFRTMVEKQEIEIPSGICADISDAEFKKLYQATVMHEKPLTNALGESFLETLTEKRVRKIFESM